MSEAVPASVFVLVEIRPVPVGVKHPDIVVKVTREDLDEHLRSIGKVKSGLAEQEIQEEIKGRAVNWALTALAEKRKDARAQPPHRNPKIITEQFALGLTTGKPRLPANKNGVEIWEVA
jgi:hypothetical protein